MTTKPDTGTPATYSPSSDPQPPAAPAKVSPVEDVVDIFYAPSDVFARRERTNFWLPLLAVTVVAALFSFVNRGVFSAIFDAEFHRATAKAMASNPQITQDMIDKGRPIQEAIAHAFAYVGTPIFIFIVALLAWLAAKIVSAKVTYEQAVLIVTLAWIPRLVEQVLVAAQNLFLDVTNVNGMFSFSFNVARFLDPDATNGKLYALAGRVDLFTLWVTFLIGVGIATIARVPRAKGYLAAAIVFVLGTLPVLTR